MLELWADPSPRSAVATLAQTPRPTRGAARLERAARTGAEKGQQGQCRPVGTRGVQAVPLHPAGHAIQRAAANGTLQTPCHRPPSAQPALAGLSWHYLYLRVLLSQSQGKKKYAEK